MKIAGQVPSNLKFEHYTAKNGLAGTTVLRILQDRSGFLWLGTSGGLSRYDGRQFKNFKHIPGDTTSLSSNDVRALYEDREGQLWVGTVGGLNCYDPATESFKVYRSDPTDSLSLQVDYVYSIEQDHNGDLWVGTVEEGGLYHFDRKKEIFHSYRHDPDDPSSISQNDIQSLKLDSKGILWIGTRGGGLDQMDMTTRKFTHHPFGAEHDLQKPLITRIIEGRDEKLYLSMIGQGVVTFEPKLKNL